ncbi:MAG TPA: glycosyltransferase [Pyrinomonadaceae bacterium]|nr:glycosyltransferase [Pyrinomonadaceae bacterium]
MLSLQTTILWAFYFFAGVSIVLGLLSLRGGLRFVRYVQSELGKEIPDFTPFVTVFLPCRGIDDGLKENIASLFAQDYPAFEVVFVCDADDDPALGIIDEARRSYQGATGPVVGTVIAGAAKESGQKVHNLRVAVREANPKSEVFVFTDTDARHQPFWLRCLVAPLRDEKIGAATGYRWFIPVNGGLASHLQSIWNASIASALGGQSEKNFCWGGSTAIRRETFARLNIRERWRGTLSDDFTVTRVLHEAGLAIKFVPHCLTPSFEDCTLAQLLEFTTRQMKITRAYAPHLWRAVLLGSLIFVVAFFGGLALVIVRAASGLSFATPLALIAVMFLLGAMKAHFRLRLVAQIISDARLQKGSTTVAQVVLWPLASLLFFYNAVAAFSRRIKWRGITYELKSPTETVILSAE